jgi:hypothetical protein
MNGYYLFLALDLARQRTVEAERARLLAEARSGQRASVGPIRRFVARTALAIARVADERLVIASRPATQP